MRFRWLVGAMLALVVALPSRAQEEPAPEKEPAEEAGKESAKQADRPPAEKPSDAPRKDKAQADAPTQELPFDIPDVQMTRSRYAFIGAGILVLGGLAFGYSAAGEAKRADTISRAVDSRSALDGARHSAATANVFFGLAAITLGYAVLLEFLPEQHTETSSPTFHF